MSQAQAGKVYTVKKAPKNDFLLKEGEQIIVKSVGSKNVRFMLHNSSCEDIGVIVKEIFGWYFV